MIELQAVQAVERYPSAVEVWTAGFHVSSGACHGYLTLRPVRFLLCAVSLLALSHHQRVLQTSVKPYALRRAFESGTSSLFLEKVSKLRRPDSNRRPTGYEPAELPLLHAAQKSIAVENLPRNPSPRNPADSLYFTLRKHWESMSSKDFP